MRRSPHHPGEFSMKWRSVAEREAVRQLAARRGISIAELFRRSLEQTGVFLPDRPVVIGTSTRRKR
jgi:hypothetical protein